MSKKFREVGKVCGAKPTGTSILVEMLTDQEALATDIIVTGKSPNVPPQGYVLATGPQFKEEDWGIKIGDRVLLQGTYVPIPKYDRRTTRELGVVEPYTVKCVLEESE